MEPGGGGHVRVVDVGVSEAAASLVPTPQLAGRDDIQPTGVEENNSNVHADVFSLDPPSQKSENEKCYVPFRSHALEHN